MLLDIEEYKPKGDIKMVVSIPHSGTSLNGYDEYLNSNAIEDIDYFVHKLLNIDVLTKNGIYIVKSNISRSVVDLNRKKSKSFFHWKRNTLGVKNYVKKPIEENYDHWVEYYEILNNISSKDILLVDLHSMPNLTKKYHFNINPFQNKKRPNICISDRKNGLLYGKLIKKIFTNKFEKVSINNPYKGGNITKHFKNIYKNAIQIEINRSLYMCEENKELLKKIDITNLLLDISKLD